MYENIVYIIVCYEYYCAYLPSLIYLLFVNDKGGENMCISTGGVTYIVVITKKRENVESRFIAF